LDSPLLAAALFIAFPGISRDQQFFPEKTNKNRREHPIFLD